MRRIAAILIGLMMALAVQAQGGMSFTTSGGLTIDVPEGYLVAEIAPQRIGLTNRETGASLLLEIVDSSVNPDEILQAELRRLGAGQVQFPALEIRAENARVVTARATRATGTVMVGQILFADGKLGLLTILPADSAPRTVIRPLIDSIRLTAAPAVSLYPACGSAELPQAITTSGGLSICFPESFVAEEKGAHALGLADLANGVIVSVYAGADLETLLGAPAADASATAAAFAETLRASGATVFASALDGYMFDAGAAFSLPLAYPKVGSGRVTAVQTPDGVILLSAVLIGLPPAGIVDTLDAVLNSAALGEGSAGLGAVRPAERLISLVSASFVSAPAWTLISNEMGMAALEHSDGSALMSAAAAPIDSSWNAASYKANVLSASAQFAGDTAFDPAALEIIAQETGVYTLEVYDSAVTVPDGSAAVNFTALLTLENRAFVVFQVSAPRDAYSAALRDEVIQMAMSAVN